VSSGSIICVIIAAAVCLSAEAEAWAQESPSGPVPLPVPRPSDLRDLAQIPVAEAQTPSVVGRMAGRRTAYRALLEREAKRYGLPFDVADAVTAIESGYDPTAVGGVGEIGLMQVRPETAAMLGFTGLPGELSRPEVNVHYGVAYLAQAWRLANGDLCRALMKYRAGHGEEVMSPLSVQYCGRAKAHLAAVGSPLADSASGPFVYDPALPRPRSARRGPPRIRTAAMSAAFWAAHEARVRALTQSLRSKWRRMASR
jgi:soluble lytic murein transglycosylase-like protein